ncbi:hypothetical protein PROFUN_01297 [Planoprotostelium fungivorum]|uniref:Ubiquitin-like protease family profile domain-containing protein n=1 Tax=Planoprotostelium fungivorum TaxID=1890364 RepID=A0A2P6NZQ6_9EUKA|nr:hypothetical protein PROFUN_01297 [Planoprotostelium fungivorum]
MRSWSRAHLQSIISYTLNNSMSVITYHDVTLYPEDVNLLKRPNWLNDNIMSFYFEYLTFERFKDQRQNFAFIHPSTVFMTTFMSGSEISEVLSALDLTSKSLVFLPINNNRDVNKMGGSHWSLLVFNHHDRAFHHYDSSSGMNSSAAQNVAAKLSSLLPVASAKVEEEVSPQQSNSYDCGVYVLALSELLAECNGEVHEKVRGLREHIGELIEMNSK